MTKEEAIKELRDASDSEVRYGDTEYHYDKVMKRVEAFDMAIKALKQETKIGHWEYVQYDSNPNIGNWHCSECRAIIPHMPVETDRTPIYKWCPMCGANMEVEE